jgi:hypothetical protein
MHLWRNRVKKLPENFKNHGKSDLHFLKHLSSGLPTILIPYQVIYCIQNHSHEIFVGCLAEFPSSHHKCFHVLCWVAQNPNLLCSHHALLVPECSMMMLDSIVLPFIEDVMHELAEIGFPEY